MHKYSKGLTIFLLLLAMRFSAQTHFTPYDELPSVIKSFKPTLQNDAPDWARLMYQYPINYNQIKKEYTEYQSIGKQKNPYTRYYKHWSRAIGPLVDDQGFIQMPTKISIQKSLTADRKRKSNFGTRNGSQWTFLGPKVTHWLKEDDSADVPSQCPWQVNIYTLDVAKSNPDIMYCGTETGAINKTLDRGQTWDLATLDYFTGNGVNSLIIHPTDPNIVYAAAGYQVHKTIDGGKTWQPLLSDLFFNANTLQLSADGRTILASADDGIYWSQDEGVNWEKKLDFKTYDIEFKPNDENTIYVLGSINGVFWLYISTDGGQSYGPLNSFPSGYTDGSGGVLAVSAANPQLLMMTLLSNNNTPILVKGIVENESWTWSEIARGLTSRLGMDNGQGYYDLDMEISPKDEQNFVVGTTTLYKTADGGATFSAIGGYQGQFAIHPDIQDLEFGANGELWVATDGGLSMSSNYFTTKDGFFVRTNGIIGSDFWGFDQGWNEDIIVAGRYHNGNTAIADNYQPKAIRMGGAESATGWVVQGKSNHVAFDDLGGGWVLPKKAEEKYQGRFLFSKFPNMQEYGGRRGSLIHHPYYHQHLYLGQQNAVWLSKDAGMTWDMLHQFPGSVMAMQMGIEDPNIIYADVVGKGLYRSDDGGLTWDARPTLTSGTYGTAYWNGKLSLAISPYNPNVIYACLQNGTWSADKGKVFKSSDGGLTWENITFGIDAYMKSLVVQPSQEKNDILYLFSNAKNNLQSDVWILNEGSQQWEAFNVGFPMGMTVNHAIPFYKSNRIRVAGNLGVWDSPLADEWYEPIIRPWAEKQVIPCFLDTISLDDHSILSHVNARWEWTIEPEPMYISSKTTRSPKIVLGREGSYHVSLKVFMDGRVFEKQIDNMLTAKKCPSVETCDNPARLSKELWQVTGFDSEEVNDPGRATMAIDNDVNTIWHTRWSTGNDLYPHFIDFDLGAKYKLFEFVYLPRQDGGVNGTVRDYELYLSDIPNETGTLIASGSFDGSGAPQVVKFPDGKDGRYIRFKALSEVNDNDWASAAEFDFTGCYADRSSTENQTSISIKSSPIPASNELHISMPSGKYQYVVYDISGSLKAEGNVDAMGNKVLLDIQSFTPGTYLWVAFSETGIKYNVRFIKL